MQVEVQPVFVTALSYYTDTNNLTLTRAAGQWTIEPASVDLTTPPEQFVRRPTVDWLSQGRSRVDEADTGPPVMLDRPELQILSARLVKGETGQFSLVGEVMNRSVDPADVTVTAYIYDDHGEELTWYNAQYGMMHKLLPLEITAFRVDFEGVAGLALGADNDLEFNPTQISPFDLPNGAQLGHFNVGAKGVVTQYDLYREVAVQNLAATTENAQLTIHGQLLNNGLLEATIPHILVTLYDEQGQVSWVEHHYLREAIRPQRAQDFAVDITPFEQLQPLPIQGHLYPHDPLLEDTAHGGPRPDFIKLPPGCGYRYARVSVNYFAAGGV
jgi:hypothetical protein